MPGDDDREKMSEELEAMAIWENHMQHATEQWHEGVSHAGEEYREGLAEGLGVDSEDVPDEAVENWKEAVMDTGPDEFAASITGQGDEWFVGLYEKVTGEEPSEEVKTAAREVEAEAVERAGEDASDEEVANAVRDVLQRRRAGE